jgi:class 3 adenylate cyclase
LVTFGADPGSVRAALRCGVEVRALMREEGVVCGLHVGPSVSGFFGEADSATRIEVGESPAVARALTQLAHAPAFYVSEAAQKAVAGDPAFLLALIGPARTQHGTLLLFSAESPADARGGR